MDEGGGESGIPGIREKGGLNGKTEIGQVKRGGEKEEKRRIKREMENRGERKVVGKEGEKEGEERGDGKGDEGRGGGGRGEKG